ncbi:MAG: 4Fe-4S cluster-binding domain-containing protein [Candidatus Heimdallarchaeota archaeon]|nr:4Fe-4S cluster-binding domain-containing protein [Candidatus Heimdallarchaeota archaeon]
MDRSINKYSSADSVCVGELPEGCKRCIAGEKIVLYVTGSCSVGCEYCPIPDEKQHRDDQFVNERKIDKIDTVFDESKVCQATGSGITGGDPMEVPERTLEYIRSIRKEYGPDYHLHLYTSGKFFIDREDLIDELFEAGLDELRFHPRNLKTKPVWYIAQRAKERFQAKSIGFEVPVISGREDDLEALILFADETGLDFVNLNEYEFTESNFNKLSQRGFVSVLVNSAIQGSKETAIEVINRIKDRTRITIHFCTSGSKDSIQLKQRFIKRAHSVKREFDAVNDEGLLEYGRMVAHSKEEYDVLLELMDEFEVEEDYRQDFPDDFSIETADYVVASIIDELREVLPDLQAELVSRYPVEDGPIITVDPL